VENRPRLSVQLAVIGALLWLYDAINNLNPVRTSTALAHGVALVHLEARMHLEPELALNRWLALHLSLGRALGDFYDLAHFLVTLSLLGWIWWRHPRHYRPLRNALLSINLIGFAVFWLFPVAPPRMLSAFGFVDIVGVTHAVGAWSSGALASQANEYAAMPSLHVAWALWCVLAVWAIRRDVRAGCGIVVYALATSVVVMATANHYFLDVVAGAATTIVATAFSAWATQSLRSVHEAPAIRPSR
jgi:hypothetical protein